MRRIAALCSCLLFVATAAPLHSESKNPADYPLRILLITRNETNFMHNRNLDKAKGEVLCPIFCTSEIVSVAQLFLSSNSRRRGCGEVGSA